jgi:outer membrane protein assembly factor BamB
VARAKVGARSLILLAGVVLAASSGTPVFAARLQLSAPLATGTAADEAVGYQLDVAHDGNQAGDPIAPPLTKLWSVSLGSALSYPLIADGRIFVTADNVGWSGHKLFALDPASGQIAWGPIDLGGSPQTASNPPEYASLAYENGRVFTAVDPGDVRAFDAASGMPLWRVQLPYQLSVVSSPIVASNGVVYVSNGNGHNELFALSAVDGHTIWHQLVSEGDNSAPAIGASAIYVSYECQDVTAMSLTDGSTLWRDTTDCFGGGGPTPVLYQGRLYVRSQWKQPEILDATNGAVLGHFTSTAIPAFDGSQGFYLSAGTLTATNLATGASNWTFAGDGQLDSNPIVANGHVYIGSASGALYVLDENSGALPWSANLGAGVAATGERHGQMFTGPAIGDGLLAVPLTGGTLVVFKGPASSVAGIAHQGLSSPTFDGTAPASDAPAYRVGVDRTGRQAGTLGPPLQQAWSTDLGGTVYYPLIAGSRVFVTAAASVSNPDSMLYALDRTSGNILWGPVDLGGGERTSAIAYDAGRVFALGPDGTVHAFDAATGHQDWTASISDAYNVYFQMSPVASAGILYVSGGGRGGNGFALSEANGSRLWKIPTVDGQAEPVIGPAGVLWGDGCNDWYDAPTGGTIWQYNGGCSGPSGAPAPAYHGSRFDTGNRVLNSSDGSVAGYYSSGPPGAYDGSMGFYLVGNVVQAEDLATNRIVWSFAGDGQLITAPLSINGVLYAGSATGTIYALNQATGATIWSGSAGAPLSGISYRSPFSDMNAGEDTLLVPAGTRLVAFGNAGSPPPGWGPWESRGGRIVSGPAATTWWGSNRLDVFVRGTDASLWDSWYDGTWHWTNLGGYPQADPGPATAPSAPGQIDLFIRGFSGGLYYDGFRNDAWSGWVDEMGQIISAPSAVKLGPNDVEAFAEGADRQLWSWSSGSGWQARGGILADGPAAVQVQTNEVDAFVEGTDRALWYWSSLSGWHRAGGVLAAKPGVGSAGPAPADAFVEGADAALWHFSVANGWEKIGGRIIGTPSPVTVGGLTRDVFVEGADHHVWRASSHGVGWGWEDLGGQLTDAPSAVSWAAGRFDVFARMADGAPWHRFSQ